MKTPLYLTALALSWLSLSSAQAVTLTFTGSGDYDNNFHEVSGGSNIGWTSSGYVEKNITTASAAIYNTHATGGTAGAGGTASGTPLDKFVNVSLQADVSFGDSFGSGSGSFGFYTNVTDNLSSGYAAIIRIESGSTATFRLFDSTGTSPSPTTAGVGNQIGSTLNFTTSGSFVKNTFYTYKLDVATVGSDVVFTASIFNVGGSQIGTSIVASDTSSAVVEGGQVGIRLGTINNNSGSFTRMDNFSVTTAAAPEPSTFALIGGLSVLGMACTKRRRRRHPIPARP